MYRRRRTQAFIPGSEEGDGVRINVPLRWIERVSKATCMKFGGLITFDIATDSTGSGGSACEKETSVPENPLTHPTHPKEVAPKVDSVLSCLPPDNQGLRFGFFRSDPAWDQFSSLVDAAKASAKLEPSGKKWPGSQVFVDMEPKGCAAAALEQHDTLTELEKNVTFALALDSEKDLWSE